METNWREVESYQHCLINTEQNHCSSYWINVVCSHSTLLPFRRASASPTVSQQASDASGLASAAENGPKQGHILPKKDHIQWWLQVGV